MALRSLSSSIFLLSSRASRVLLRVPALPRSSPLLRLRPLVLPLAEGLDPSGLLRASSTRCFSSSRTASSLNDPSPNWSNRPPKETILLDGCDFEHWLVVVEPPDPSLTRDDIIKSYIKTLAQVVGSEEDARFKIYSVSTKHYFAFGALVSEELSYKIKELPGVRWVLPDSYLNVKEKDYGGEPFINGEAVPYDPKYHEEWVRNNARANERNRRNDRPRNSDRSRNFERRRENMQTFQNRPPPPPMSNQGVGNPAGPNPIPGQSPFPPQGAGHAPQNVAPPMNPPNMGAPQNVAPPMNAPNMGVPQNVAPPMNAPNMGAPQNVAPPMNAANGGGPNRNFGGYQNQNSNYQNNIPNPYQGGPNNAYQGAPGNAYQGAPGNAYRGGPGYQGGSNTYQGGPTGYQGPPPSASHGDHAGYQGAPNPSQGGHPGYQGAPNPSQGGHPGYQGAPNTYQGGPGAYQGGAGYQGAPNSFQATGGPDGSQQPRDVPGRD